MRAMHRAWAYAVSVALLALAIWPAFRRPVIDDSFPLSTFPMFSASRPRRMTITHVLAVHADGTREPLPPSITSDNPEVLQSMMTIRRAAFAPPDYRAKYCRTVAKRVVDSGNDEWDDVEQLEIATSLYDAVDYFEDGPEPLKRRIRHRCEVHR